MDPVTSHASPLEQPPKSSDNTRPVKSSYLSTSQVNEVWASTKPYPGWWTDLEENKALRRRKSVDDPVLERNICFVDTPGYGRGLSITGGIQTTISYIEEQLPRSFSAATGSRGELISMLSGNGGTQVDVVLYLIGRGIYHVHLVMRVLLTFGAIRNKIGRSRLPTAAIANCQRDTLAF